MKNPRRALLALSLVLCLSACAGCAPKELSRSEYVLGTFCTIRMIGGGDERLLDAAFARLREIEDELSVNKDGSRIDEANEAAGKAAVPVGPDAMAILKRDLELAALSGGAFDPSVGTLVKLWGIGTDRARLPSPEEIARAKALVGWKDIILDETKGTVFLKRKGMALDLGSTTKGFAADEVAALLRKAKVKTALIDLGGNIYVVGKRADGKKWRIGLQDPFSQARGAYLGIASLSDMTMVTSGVYERYFIVDGKRYHHILDTSTGRPVDNGLMSVTVVAPRSFDADGFTTAVFALGRVRGMALAAEKGVDVLVVDKDRKVYASPGVSSYFRITDPSFSLAE